MKTRLFYLILFSSQFIFNNSRAQEIYQGTRKNLQTNIADAVSYSVSSSSYQNTFNNHYSIFIEPEGLKADTIYTVNLNFNKEERSIYISQSDKLTNQSSSRTISFQPLSYQIKQSDAKPIYCINNYLSNDTLISVTEDNKSFLLFTIADTTNPLFFLHQITSIDGNYRFDLDKFRKSYLTPHLAHARDYWEWYVADSIQRMQNQLIIDQNKAKFLVIQTKINDEILKINADIDSLIKKLTERKIALQLSEMVARPEWQEIFFQKMDRIVSQNLKRTFSYNTEVKGSFKVIYSSDKKIQISRSINTGSKFFPDIDWLKERTKNIEEEISQLKLENEKASIIAYDPNLIIMNKHVGRCDKLRLEMVSFNLSFENEFASALNEAKLKLAEEFPKDLIDIATIYDYSFKFTTQTEYDRWFLTRNGISDTKDTTITNKENIDIFYEKNPKAKNGKYDVRLNTAFLNDSIILGPELDLAERKYKYITHIGFSVGSILTSGDWELGNETYSGQLNYWNAFLIYHHFGVFGGKSMASSPVSTDYSEFGLYLAPGNVLHFKFGLAKCNQKNIQSKTNMIVGASLIFPVFHIEGGYNLLLEYPYIMAGFNIPINF
jgi:hypothetical protein